MPRAGQHKAEIIAEGAWNNWICQMGRKAEDGEYVDFAQRLSTAEVTFSGLNLSFQSPDNGVIRFGWESGFSLDRVETLLHDYPRYGHPMSMPILAPTKSESWQVGINCAWTGKQGTMKYRFYTFIRDRIESHLQLSGICLQDYPSTQQQNRGLP